MFPLPVFSKTLGSCQSGGENVSSWMSFQSYIISGGVAYHLPDNVSAYSKITADDKQTKYPREEPVNFYIFVLLHKSVCWYIISKCSSIHNMQTNVPVVSKKVEPSFRDTSLSYLVRATVDWKSHRSKRLKKTFYIYLRSLFYSDLIQSIRNYVRSFKGFISHYSLQGSSRRRA